MAQLVGHEQALYYRRMDDSLVWEFYVDARGRHRWRAMDMNNRKILFVSSEGYRRRIDSAVCAKRAGWTESHPRTVSLAGPRTKRLGQ